MSATLPLLVEAQPTVWTRLPQVPVQPRVGIEAATLIDAHFPITTVTPWASVYPAHYGNHHRHTDSSENQPADHVVHCRRLWPQKERENQDRERDHDQSDLEGFLDSLKVLTNGHDALNSNLAHSVRTWA